MKNMKITTIIFCILLMLPILAITAAANQPPSAPDIEGPASGKVRTQITYGFFVVIETRQSASSQRA